uniref:Uncharacterized protein n=1 Tax=Arundo donax TaxID=35708 RepID=A0A0A9BXQ6_ARUDO
MQDGGCPCCVFLFLTQCTSFQCST